MYVPDISKPRERREEFYNILKINSQGKILLMGDLNPRMERNVSNGISQDSTRTIKCTHGKILEINNL